MALTMLMRSLKPSFVLMACLVLGMLLTTSSFYIEHVLDVHPCPMCLWQRYTHVAIWGIALAGLALGKHFKPRFFLVFVLFAMVASGGIGFYQWFGQLGILTLPESCTGSLDGLATAGNLLEALMANEGTSAPSCADVDFTILGQSLASWNFIIMLTASATLIFWFLFTMGAKRSK